VANDPNALDKRLSWAGISRLSLLLAGLTVVSACTTFCERRHEQMSPEEVVEAYLDVALNIHDVSQREELMRYTTGNLKSAIAQVSDEVIRQAYIERNLAIERYSVVQRRDRTPIETEITFELVYREYEGGPNIDTSGEAPVVVTENTVSVVRERGLWLIRDVLGKKTSIEFPIMPDSIIHPGADPEPGLDDL